MSKVLRQKEKYLYPDDGSRSPAKRSKGKFPDIERALAVWAKNAHKKGVGLTDKMIWDRARLFATSIGISETHFKANSQGWLEKFKQKNGLVAKADPDGGSSSGSLSGRARSVSSVDMMGSPMTISRSQDSHYGGMTHLSPDSFLDWGSDAGGDYKNTGSRSTSSDSLSSIFTNIGAVASPTSPFFSPGNHRIDSGRPSPVFPSQQARIPRHQPQARPRSQTFPCISVDPSSYLSPPPSDPLTPKINPQVGSMSRIDPALSNGPEDTQSSLASPQATPPTVSINMPPSKEDAKRALEIVVSYLRQQSTETLLEPDEFIVINKLLGRFGMENIEGQNSTMLGISS